jgi:hypothetical protein
MISLPTRVVVATASLTAGLLWTSAVGLSQSNQPAERFTAFAVSLGGNARRSGAGVVQITVDRWSADSDRQRLIDTLQAKGPGELLEVMRDTRQVGHIRTPDSLGYPLRYAHQRPDPEGGRRVVIATDRPISFWEQVNQPRTIDYPFTVIQLHIGTDGTGEGRMAVATRIIAHDNIIELEHYETQPVMLQQVRAEPVR